MTNLMYLPGDVALARGNDAVGLAIQFGTRSRFNHVRLVTNEVGHVLEADPSGAEWGLVHPDDVVVRPPLTMEQRSRIDGIAAHLHGTPYGFLDCAALGLAQFGLTLPSVTRRVSRPDRLFCSQLVDYAWFLSGFRAFDDGRVPQDVSPGDIADLAFRAGWKVVNPA